MSDLSYFFYAICLSQAPYGTDRRTTSNSLIRMRNNKMINKKYFRL